MSSFFKPDDDDDDDDEFQDHDHDDHDHDHDDHDDLNDSVSHMREQVASTSVIFVQGGSGALEPDKGIMTPQH